MRPRLYVACLGPYLSLRSLSRAPMRSKRESSPLSSVFHRRMPQRAVQPPHQRQHPLEVCREERREPWARGLAVAHGAAGDERLKLEPARRGVGLVVAARHSLQLRLVIDLAEPAHEAAIRDHPLEALEILRDGLAQLVEDWTRWHPHPTADERLAGLEMEVVTRASRVRLVADARVRVAMPEPARGVRLIGRLVFGEPHVPIDPEQRALGRSEERRVGKESGSWWQYR